MRLISPIQGTTYQIWQLVNADGVLNMQSLWINNKLPLAIDVTFRYIAGRVVTAGGFNNNKIVE